MYSLAFMDSMGSVWGEITNWLNALIMVVVNMLPNSPFQSITIPSAVSDVLGYINYIIPVGQMVITATAWLTAVLGYYVIKVVLNWLGVIKS